MSWYVLCAPTPARARAVSHPPAVQLAVGAGMMDLVPSATLSAFVTVPMLKALLRCRSYEETAPLFAFIRFPVSDLEDGIADEEGTEFDLAREWCAQPPALE